MVEGRTKLRHIPTLEERLHTLPLKRYIDESNSVPRWNNQEAPDGYRETLVGHARGMNEMVDQLAQNRAIRKAIRLRRLNVILGVHDLGEVGTGDVDRAKVDYEKQRTNLQETEYDFFMKHILPSLPYSTQRTQQLGELLDKITPNFLPRLRKTAEEGYIAFEDLGQVENLRSSQNEEALLAKVLDRMDAVNKGVDHFHVGKTGEEREDAVIRQLAGANRASSLALYRLFEVLGFNDKKEAMQHIGQFMLDHKQKWDIYDPRIFDTPRIAEDGHTWTYGEKLPSFAEALREISDRYHITFTSTDGKDTIAPQTTDLGIQNFLMKATTTTLPQHI